MTTNFQTMPQMPLPSTAQLTAIIDVIEPTILHPLAQPITWLRDRLDPFHAAEQEEKNSNQTEDGLLSEEESDGLEGTREIKRGAKGEADSIVPYKFKDSTFKKMSTAIRQERLKKDTERKRRPGREKEINLMDQTYHHPKLDLKEGQEPYSTKVAKVEEKKSRVTTYGDKYSGTLEEQQRGAKTVQKELASQEAKSGAVHGQQHRKNLKATAAHLETMKVPHVRGHPPDVKIRLYPEEEPRVAKELEEAMNNNFFELWPSKTDTESELDKSKKPKESVEFRAALDNEAQARKLELLKQWKSKDEKDNKRRRKAQERADYEDDEMMDILMGASIFKPTLSRYVDPGKNIPNREEVVAEYEAIVSVYEDALEILPPSSKKEPLKDKDTNSKGKRDSKLSAPRRTYLKSTESDEEEPAFAPRK